MKSMSNLFLFLSVFVWISCEKSNDPVIDDSDLLNDCLIPLHTAGISPKAQDPH